MQKMVLRRCEFAGRERRAGSARVRKKARGTPSRSKEGERRYTVHVDCVRLSPFVQEDVSTTHE